MTKLSAAAAAAALSLQLSDSQGGEFQADRNAMIEHLARELGVSEERVASAFASAQARLGCGGGGASSGPTVVRQNGRRIGEVSPHSIRVRRGRAIDTVRGFIFRPVGGPWSRLFDTKANATRALKAEVAGNP